jgi:hypothetical protein
MEQALDHNFVVLDPIKQDKRIGRYDDTPHAILRSRMADLWLMAFKKGGCLDPIPNAVCAVW